MSNPDVQTMHRAPVPVHLDGQKGRLFAVYYPPAAGAAPRGQILFVAPFAEELNEFRYGAALQARRFSSAGFGTMLLDLFGCGESGGHFEEATWAVWKTDVCAAVAWLDRQHGGPLIFWGIRTGAMLALDVAGEPGMTIHGLLLWSPVVDGGRYIEDVLRRQAIIDGAAGRGATLRWFRDQLAAGNSVEALGYELSAVLVQELQSLSLFNLPTPKCRVDWFDLNVEENAYREGVDGWKAQGVPFRRHQGSWCCRRAYGQLELPTLGPFSKLMEATCRALEEVPNERG